MNKRELKSYCESNLGYEQMNEFSEYAQFCEETLYEVIPYLSVEGLRYLKKQIDSVKKQVSQN